MILTKTQYCPFGITEKNKEEIYNLSNICNICSLFQNCSTIPRTIFLNHAIPHENKMDEKDPFDSHDNSKEEPKFQYIPSINSLCNYPKYF